MQKRELNTSAFSCPLIAELSLPSVHSGPYEIKSFHPRDCQSITNSKQKGILGSDDLYKDLWGLMAWE